MRADIFHTPAQQAFVADVDGATAVCAYRRDGDMLVLHHTEVPAALQGRGLAAALVQAALDWARAEGLVVRPSCSYVAAYMRRHPETQDLLAPRRADS
jgi:predicted GNAT family acetyltransferase